MARNSNQPETVPLASYALSLRVQDARCFGSEQTLALSDANGVPVRWTFLLGPPGSGKTTLLQLMALIDYSHAFQFASVGGWDEFLRSLVRHNRASLGTCRLRVGGFERLDQPPARTCDYGYTFNATSVRELPPPVRYGHVPLPMLYAYGPSRRLPPFGSGQEATDGTVATLFSNAARLRDPDDWLARPRTQGVASADRIYALEEILRAFVPEIHEVRLAAAQPSCPLARAEVRTDHGWLPLRWLGLGQQTVIAWVFDLFTRMAEHFAESRYPLTEPAVVLVDGLDAHLEPRSAERLICELSQRFPAVQFVVSVQNPELASVVPGANVVRLIPRGDLVVLESL